MNKLILFSSSKEKAMRLQLFMSRKKMTSQLSVNDWLDVIELFFSQICNEWNGKKEWGFIYVSCLEKSQRDSWIFIIFISFFCASFNSHLHNCKRQFLLLLLALLFACFPFLFERLKLSLFYLLVFLQKNLF